MTAKTHQQVLDGLADVLVEDIVSTPADQLLAEVAEDYGNARALAVTFDKIALRARSGNDRSATRALPFRANGILGGLLPEGRPHLAGRLKAFWQNVIPSIFDVVFPNRLAMITVSSACIASLAVIIAAPTVFDRIQTLYSGVPSGPEGASTGPQSAPSVRERTANEGSVTRGLYPSAPPSRPDMPGVLDLPSGAGYAGSRPQPGAGETPLQSMRSVPPLAALREPSAANLVAPPAAAPSVASAATPAADSYVVQVALRRNKADAEASVRNLQAKFSKELGDQKAMVRRADLGPNGVYYRAVVGPFGSADAAGRFCSNLKAAGAQCVVQTD